MPSSRITAGRRAGLAPLLLAAAGLMACGDHKTVSPAATPGAAPAASTQVLEAGAAVLQDKPPIEALNVYLDGFHFYNGQPTLQMEAHHYCSLVNEDVIQCVIYDGNTRGAKIMGIEYVVSERVFTSLPEAEKPLWHSHVHEVKSGQLIAPGIPEVAEDALMRKLVGTYGKTWHTWHTDLHKGLPLGVPQLMMGFTADGQADAAMVAARDKRFDIDSARKKERRNDIPAPAVQPGANGWQHGKTIQIPDPTGSQHGAEHAARQSASQAKQPPGASAPASPASNARSHTP